jgi:hypothetical protein
MTLLRDSSPFLMKKGKGGSKFNAFALLVRLIFDVRSVTTMNGAVRFGLHTVIKTIN